MAYDPNEYHHVYRDDYQPDDPHEPGGWNVHDDPYQPGEVYLYPPPIETPRPMPPLPETEPYTVWHQRTFPQADSRLPQQSFLHWLQTTWPLLLLHRLVTSEVDETTPKPVGLLARLRGRR